MRNKFLLELVRVFIFAFIGAVVPLLSGATDFSALKNVGIAAGVAGIAAGVKAVVDILTKGASPLPGTGILPPSIKPK